MLDKKYLGKVRVELLAYSLKRREVIKTAGDAQHLAKKAIFALQRDNKEEGKAALAEAERLLLELYVKHKSEEDLFDEGCYRAALEEYTEANLFWQFLTKTNLGPVKTVKVDGDIFVGGLCDVPGELLRYAIKAATARDFGMVEKCYAVAEEIIGELISMDLTGYNRQKFDQAKQALHKLEQVRYEVSLKNV